MVIQIEKSNYANKNIIITNLYDYNENKGSIKDVYRWMYRYWNGQSVLDLTAEKLSDTYIITKLKVMSKNS